jgi:ribosomal protein S18 acetylase RimI-like enzyme
MTFQIQEIAPKSLDNLQDIFVSFTKDYPNFYQWLDNVKTLNNRRVFVTKQNLTDKYQAIAILKINTDNTIKISTFKVLETARNKNLGSKLMNTIVNLYPSETIFYIETKPHNKNLISFLNHNGFIQIDKNLNHNSDITLTRI